MNTIGKTRLFPRNSLGRHGWGPGILLLAALLPPGARPRAQGESDRISEGILQAEERRAAHPGDLPLLTGALGHGDPQVVRRAARALGRLERPALGELLLPLLGHDDASVRRSATEGIAQALQGFRGDSSSERRGLLWGKLVAGLRTRLREDRDTAARAMAALSLGRLPYLAPGEITEIRGELVSLCVETKSPGKSLGEFCRGAEMLVRASWRRVALTPVEQGGLRSVVRAPASGPAARRHALGALLAAQAADDSTLAAAGSDPDEELRRLAFTGLRRREGAAEPAPLARGLRDRIAAVRLEALRALARVAGEKACARLLAGTRDPVPAVALTAIDLLSGCGADPASVRRLEMVISSRRAGAWHAPAHAMVALARAAPGRASEWIPPLAVDPDWRLRMYVARAAAAARDPATLRLLASDLAPNVREAALAGLQQTVGHSADPLYRDALRGRDLQLLLTAARALAGTSDKAATAPPALEALDKISSERIETSRDTRLALLALARETGSPDLAPRLLPYLKDFDPVVAESAAAVLSAWTGERKPTNPMVFVEIAPIRWTEVTELRGARLMVVMESGKQFEAELLMDVAPLTAVRVARLAKRGYYHTLSFHRVAPNFVIQGGGPAGNEYSGAKDFMPDELSDVSHARGTVGISTRGRDTGDAQLFINLRDNPRLDYDYTVFARITAGLEVVDGVLEGDRILRIEVRQAERVGSADTAALMRTVRVLAADSMEGRQAGTAGGARARRYLVDRLRALGLRPWGARYEHPFRLRRDSAVGTNLLAVIPGKRRDLPYLVLSAHYDHEGIKNGQVYNGADDNASGVAAVLAIAASLKQRPLDHPVLLALFDAEEAGLLGARALVADSALRRAGVALNVNLDMVSHSEAGVLWTAGSAHHPELRPVLEAIAARAPVILKLGHDRRGVPGEQDWSGSSDHGPFHAAKIPFVYFGVEDHQDYHKPTDDPETVTVGFFGGAVATIEAALRALDALRLTP